MKSLGLLFLIGIYVACHPGLIEASTPVDENQVKNVEKMPVNTEQQRQALENAAVMLANYEIEAKKLVDLLDLPKTENADISQLAWKLINISESFIESTRFRLPQCDEYLLKSVAVKDMLENISHENLEKNYHHDGALPKAPFECYHTKDLLVHPATVIVLTRDDPELAENTLSSIRAEITEVLAHTEIVRQLVIY